MGYLYLEVAILWEILHVAWLSSKSLMLIIINGYPISIFSWYNGLWVTLHMDVYVWVKKRAKCPNKLISSNAANKMKHHKHSPYKEQCLANKFIYPFSSLKVCWRMTSVFTRASRFWQDWHTNAMACTYNKSYSSDINMMW